MTKIYDSSFARNCGLKATVGPVNGFSRLLGTDVPLRSQREVQSKLDAMVPGDTIEVVIRYHPKHGAEKATVECHSLETISKDRLHDWQLEELSK